MLLLSGSCSREAERGSGGLPHPEKHLLLDSRVVAVTRGVRLVPGVVRKDHHNPLFGEDKPWEVRFDNLYPNVIYDEEEHIYKCWYNPFIVDPRTTETPPEKRSRERYVKGLKPGSREMGVCYAVSRDGIHWEKPELGIVEFAGSKKNNLVVWGPSGAGVFKDPHDPDPNRRYKMFCQPAHATGQLGVAFSPDGLHWTEPLPRPEIKARADTHNNALWVPGLGKYVGFTRLWDRNPPDRLVGRTESPDFLKWTRAVAVLRSLPEEGADRQTYAMVVFPYAGVYLGLVMMFNRTSDTVDCELTWSPDTVHWERIAPGTPFIPRGPKGSYDSGCIYAAACPVVLEDEIRLYYAGSDGPHGGWRKGFLCLAHLRPDGFAGYEPSVPDTPGVVVTRPVECGGGELRVTADARGGVLRVGVDGMPGFGVKDCEPITGDVTDYPVKWKGGKDLSPPAGKRIRLRFELDSARLYSFSFR